MTKLKLGLAITAIAVAGAACGDDAAKNNPVENNTNNMGTNNGTTANNNPTNNNTTPNNNPTNNNTTANNNPTNNMTFVPPPDVPSCDDTPPPARCAEDPSARTWAPASVIDFFFVEGTETDPVCCFDYTDDGEIDNSLGESLAGLDATILADINTGIEDSIANGSLVLVLEHDGLDDLANDDAFDIGFFIGAHEDETAFMTDGFLADSNAVLLDPASFDMGSHPQALLPMASNTGGEVTAGPGSVKIEIELFDSPLQLTISLARTKTQIDAAASVLDASGVALQQGELGGVVKVQDVFTAVNEFAANACECLGLGAEPLVDTDSGTCSANADAMACDDAGETTCSSVAGACGAFGAVALFADVDLDGDGLTDSISIGASYTAVGATINGLTP